MSIKKKDNLGDRMKRYEDSYRLILPQRMPVIIRIDGKAFHTFTRGFKKPFDNILRTCMRETAVALCKQVEGCKLAYTQSDEISLLLTDYDTLETQPWFGNNLQKLVSVSASIATLTFNRVFQKEVQEYGVNLMCSDMTLDVRQEQENLRNAYVKALNSGALFDARAFVLPKEDVCNYFIWRQQDAIRNSIQMLGRAYFSDKQLHKKNCAEIKEMLSTEKNVIWEELLPPFRQGTCVYYEDSSWVPNSAVNFAKLRYIVEDRVELKESAE